jgi:hypothetical protein
MTIEQLQELFPELTPLHARLLLESVVPKARDDTGRRCLLTHKLSKAYPLFRRAESAVMSNLTNHICQSSYSTPC